MRDLIGKRFGKLVVLIRNGKDKFGRAKWLCKCDCGNEKIILEYVLIQEKTKSCGCLKKESMSKSIKKHGMAGTRVYWSWKEMRQRCNNPKNHAYKWYGGLGIKVCKEWDKFENYYKWLIENNYKEKLTVDRIDSNGNYCPENCRLITIQEQQKCKKNSIYYKGRLAVDIAREKGITWQAFYYRLSHGYAVEEALNPNFKRTNYQRSKNGRFKNFVN